MVSQAIIEGAKARVTQLSAVLPTREEDLRYAATARCRCGAGMAYNKTVMDPWGSWRCSNILKHQAKELQEGQHHDVLPFSLYTVKSEDQIGAFGATTRPQ